MRARKSLHLLLAKGAGGAQEFHPYVLDIPEQHADYIKVSVGGMTKITRSELLTWLDKQRKALEFSRLRAKVARRKGT